MKTVVAAALMTMLAQATAAQGWPSQSVHLIVPASPGSSLDVVARVVGERLAARWKQPVVVEDKAGAGGMLGMNAVAKAPPDGYTLAVGFNGPVAIAPLLYRKMAYDPAKDAGDEKPPSVFEELLERTGPRPDLKWFFTDWVDADKGLPDLALESVFPQETGAGNWLVAVNVANRGYAAAEVPVTVKTFDTSTTQRVRVSGRGKVVQRIVIQGRPTEVQVNDGTVPETQASVHVTSIEQSSPAGP